MSSVSTKTRRLFSVLSFLVNILNLIVVILIGLVGWCKGIILIKHAFSQTKSFSKFTVFGGITPFLIIGNSGQGAIIFDYGKK